ncbi:hypothetical protein PHMEG_00025299 [Phytophthora megakarya]|uniref:MULE transposase domain-containing protein n=1 Tax=Phytophthora megakarya TaxID=4795 RepID=A0A225VDT3_9STRA|nr:hypothetical protein PHMEG_00025299 [Phytophthora megakarya]
MGRVHRTRRTHFGGNIYGVVEVALLALVAGSDLNFFQYHHTYYENGQLQRIIGWAHPRLLELLRYPGIQMFVDGTFPSVPRAFHQCVVLMVRDPASRVFVPVVYTLTTNRITSTYNRMFGFIADAVGQPLKPAQVVVDFEQALIDSVEARFPTVRVIGCLFHWKQAIGKRMVVLHFPLLRLMEVGIMDMLTVIRPDDVDLAGIRFVERRIRSRCREETIQYSTERWLLFWVYFRRTWLVLFPVNVWNVHGMDLQIVSRTNNPLERFNRELNAAITAPHPRLSAFVGMIEVLSRRYVRLLDDITNRRAVAPQQGAIQVPVTVELTRQGTVRRQMRQGRRQNVPVEHVAILDHGPKQDRAQR